MVASTIILNAGGGGQRLASDIDANGIETLAVSATISGGLKLAMGEIVGQTDFFKYGKNIDIGTLSDPEDVWHGGGLYIGFPTGAAETLEIFSSDAADSSGGTGARTVSIQQLQDSTGLPMPDITLTLNGVTPVSLGAQTYRRCTRVKVLTAGTGGANAGALTLRHTTTTTNIFAVMPVLSNQTAICAYSVPLGFTLYVDYVQMLLSRASGAAGSANVSLRARPLGEVFQTKISPTITNSSGFSHTEHYFEFAALTDIVVRVDSVSDNLTIVSGELGGILVAILKSFLERFFSS